MQLFKAAEVSALGVVGPIDVCAGEAEDLCMSLLESHVSYAPFKRAKTSRVHEVQSRTFVTLNMNTVAPWGIVFWV